MDLAFLHPLYEHPGPWASVYVDTSRPLENTPHDRGLRARAMARELAGQGADEATCRAVSRELEERRHYPEPRGRALFARDGEVVLDPPLARSPRHDRADWAPLPRVAPLLELAEDPVCIVAYVDRKGAGFELRRTPARSEAAGWVDWSERHFQLRVENTWEHNAAEIADALAVCQEDTGADLLILVGEDRERRSVYERLPRRLHDRVVQSPQSSGSRLLDEDLDRARAEHAGERTAAEVERFLAARGTGEEGHVGAVEGVAALVEAAREHRIEELLIRPDGPDAHCEVWIGEDPDQLAVRRTDLRIPGEQRSWRARADDALIRSAVATHAEALAVTPPPDTAEDTPLGGLGALLRWT